jgi:hypothetical protein
MSGFCKVEVSKLPFRLLAEAEIGILTMSGNQLQRIEVLAEVLSGRRTEASAAAILGISSRGSLWLVCHFRGFHLPVVATPIES